MSWRRAFKRGMPRSRVCAAFFLSAAYALCLGAVFFFCFSCFPHAASAGELELWQQDVRKGRIPTREGSVGTEIALDEVLKCLGLARSGAVSEGLVVVLSGKKLEFWRGSNAARAAGELFSLPAPVVEEAGHWWGESSGSLQVINRFMSLIGQKQLRLVKADSAAATSVKSTQGTPTGTSSASVSPIPVPSASGTQEMLLSVRWGQQPEAYRVVFDLTKEIPVTLKKEPQLATLLFEAKSMSDPTTFKSPYPDFLQVKGTSEGKGTSFVVVHKATRVESFWLTNPARYVVDFYFSGKTPPVSASSSANGATSANGSAAATPSATVKKDPIPITNLDIKTTPTQAQAPAQTQPQTPSAGGSTWGGSKKRALVVVDAGHGGQDPGAVANGLKEKDINLLAAQSLTAKLQAAGVDVRQTRTTDKYLKLAERTLYANESEADLFVSLHCNALPAGRHATGTEIYLMALPTDKDAMNLALFENKELGASEKDAEVASDKKTQLLLKILGDMQQNEKISESTTFAEALYEQMKTGGLPAKRVAQAPFFVLRGAAMPAVLIEMGFLTEKSDAQKLRDAAWRDRLCTQLANGIVRYLGSLQ